MAAQTQTNEQLLNRAAAGDGAAMSRLFTANRSRLRQMVALRLDPRLAARVDPSDVVQEVLLKASREFNEFLRQRPLPFYPWLRQFACDRLVELRRRHIEAGRRSVSREEPGGLLLSDDSAALLAERLSGGSASPSRRLIGQERRQQVQAALARLPANQREVLVLRYLEQLPTSEIAAVLAITEGAVKGCHRRGLERLRDLLGNLSRGDLS